MPLVVGVVEVRTAAEVVVVEVVGIVIGTRTKTQTLPLQGRDIRVPGTLIFRLAMCPNTALCIISGVGGVTSAPSQPHVRGKMFMQPDLKNETGTSPVTPNQT